MGGQGRALLSNQSSKKVGICLQKKYCEIRYWQIIRKFLRVALHTEVDYIRLFLN